MSQREELGAVIEQAVMRLRAEDGDAHETGWEIEEWQAEVLQRLGDVVHRAGHPSATRLVEALGIDITMSPYRRAT